MEPITLPKFHEKDTVEEFAGSKRLASETKQMRRLNLDAEANANTTNSYTRTSLSLRPLFLIHVVLKLNFHITS